MTVQEGRSKDRVVRLEPFFTDGAVAALDRPVPDTRDSPTSHGIRLVPAATERRAQAARDEGRAAAAVCSNRTLTRFETPDSSIVTP